VPHLHDDRYFLAAIEFCSQSNNTVTSNVTGMARLQARVTSVMTAPMAAPAPKATHITPDAGLT
jgi:hypothetical protein